MSEIVRVRTPTLEIGYEAHGDAGGVPIVLLHGFPDDARAWDDVAPPLAAAGYRVLVPYLRGYGPTRFLNPEEPRMAQQAAIGRGRAVVLVSVVLQHRAWAAGAREEPPRDLPAPVGGMVAELAIRSGDVRPHGRLLRQPRLRGGGDPLLSPPSRQRSGRWAPGRDRAAPRPAAADHRSHRDPARGGRHGG